MPKIHLKPQFVANPPRSMDKPKIDYFDTQLAGFMLEVRQTGTATYYIRYRDKGGYIRQIKIGTPDTMSLEEARSTARTLKSQAVIGFDPREAQRKLKAMPTFKEFVFNQYLPYVKTYKRSWQHDQVLIEQRLLRLWSNRRMSEFTTQDLIAFQNTLVKGKLQPGTVNRYMAMVKYIFNLAERWEIIDKAPTRNVKPLEDYGGRERFLSPEELQRLLQALNDCNRPVLPDVFRFLLLTGARRNEALQLEWKELDLVNGIWTLPAERNKAKKTKVIPISSEALNIVLRYRGNGFDHVFINPETGQPFNNTFWTWERIRIKAGMPELRVHDLRHAHASLLVNNGRSLYEVQKLLGHSQLSTTQRYAHLSQDTLRQATEEIGQLVGMVKVENDT